MSNRRLNADSNTIDYVLNTYSNYIDNLQIIKLKELLFKDKHHYDSRTVIDIISSVMQLIIDECGPDIVNSLRLPYQGFYGYYTNVVFDDHVEIRRDITDAEFSFARFNDGITVYSKKLPQQAIASTYMNGVVDLTNVVELGGFNLNYANDDNDVTVKLSKDLKKIDCFAFVTEYSSIVVEYTGTVHEFNNMVFENFLSWPESHKKGFDYLKDAPKIKCLDGNWDYEVFENDQRYHEWEN